MKSDNDKSGHSAPNTEKLKCFDCIMALELPEGIWCIKFKGLVNEIMAEKCENFVGKKILGCGDDYEGQDF